ncbi:MAG: ATP-binding cassette domain-containing protein [Mariprofundaceae bacterium]|nr:ATP-binding cassette domain-containing protein [Mariprofundaceae bacterium]
MFMPSDGRCFFIPQVIQSSTMDCGPAALKSLLAGYGVYLDYGRLREACQTDVDGTSIDTIEDLAIQLGLDAAQLLIPLDHVLLPEAEVLPALVVTMEPGGFTHFIVIWRIVGGWVQIMDPSTGRHWVRLRALQERFYSHQQAVSAEDWLEWARSDAFLEALETRMCQVCDDPEWAKSCIQTAVKNSHWSGLATLDAATRMVSSLVEVDAIRSGTEAGALVNQLTEHPADIPSNHWLIYPDNNDPTQMLFRCAVTIHIAGLMDETDASTSKSPPIADLEIAKKADKPKVEQHIFAALRRDGLLTPSLIALGLLFSALGVALEVLVFRGLIEIGQQTQLLSQQMEAFTLVVFFLLSLLILEWPLSLAGLAMGRKLEIRLRQQFLQKIPRLEDRYFHSRLTSDMIQRAYELRELRNLPDLAANFLRLLMQIMLVTIGLIILYPAGTWLILFSIYMLLWLAFISQPLLQEQDMQFRTHTGGLSRFYLDALQGITPIQAHRAAPSIQTEHDQLLLHWVKSGRSFYNSYELSALIQLLVSSTLVIILVIAYLGSSAHDSSGTLLFLYWMLQLPLLGTALADLARQYPAQRNRLLRLLEPLEAMDESLTWYADDLQRPPYITPQPNNTQGVHLHFHQVNLNLSGHRVLDELNLHLRSGEHIAIVGKSGAGKSSLIGLLLGWHRPVEGGSLWVDGQLLHGERLHQLRRDLVWVDPEVQLWNRSLVENINYGKSDASINATIPAEIWSQADLLQILDHLSEREHTLLGENGGLLSGGEAQRVRLARGLNRQGARLVILDEPFRGLTRNQRRTLLQQARDFWQEATLVFISHDVEDTLTFDRVLVMDGGRVVEDGQPGALVANEHSHYLQLLNSERSVRELIWNSADWRRLRLEGGKLLVSKH